MAEKKRRYVRELKKEYPDMPRACLHCQLFLGAEEQMIPGVQVHYGTSGKTVLLILEDPDYSIRTLSKYIKRDIKDHDVWVTTAVKCTLMGRDIKTANVNHCSEFVKEDIDNINPDVVISLGTWGLEAWKKVQQRMEEEITDE